MAFFPCIYFCENNQLYFTGKHNNLRLMNAKEKSDILLRRSRNRQYFYELCMKLFALCDSRGLRLIVENPYATQHYLVENFPYKASVIDRDRTMRGDFFKKPTQYWFVRCDPMVGYYTEQHDKNTKRIAESKSGKEAGLCSEDRSMISPDYARNFICDFILGKSQPDINPTLFD